MNVRIASADMNRMMKVVNQCVDSLHENVEVIYDNGLLTVRGSNGMLSAVASTPMLGGDGESFLCDGAMLTRVCAMCKGMIDLTADGKNVTVKGAGRTRIPVVSASVPAFQHVRGKSVTVSGGALSRCWNRISYAVSSNAARVVLTGVMVKTDGTKMRMAALDGFQLATDSAECSGDEMDALIPGVFLKAVAGSVGTEDEVKITTDGTRVQVTTDGLMMNCPLLHGEFPPYESMVPQEFKVEALVKVGELADAIKSGSVVQNKTSTVKLEVGNGVITVRNNSEQADYEAEVACESRGTVKIAFNEKYLLNALNMVDAEDAVVKMNGPVNPCVVQGKDEDGIHLLLPVRVMG